MQILESVYAYILAQQGGYVELRDGGWRPGPLNTIRYAMRLCREEEAPHKLMGGFHFTVKNPQLLLCQNCYIKILGNPKVHKYCSGKCRAKAAAKRRWARSVKCSPPK
jgi:hypothetical protein